MNYIEVNYLKYLRLAILTLLLFSTYPASIAGQPTRTNEYTSFNSLRSAVDLPLISPQSAVIEQDYIREYIIFADNQAEYESIIETFEVKTTYPYLQAVRTSFWNSMYAGILGIFPQRVVPSEAFDSVTRIEATFNENLQSALIPNGVPDANLMGVTELWNQGYNGTGVKVAVFDNGVDDTHPGLVGKVAQKVKFNVDPDGNSWTILRDHGTPVAGTIVSTGAGTGGAGFQGNAFGAQIVDMTLGTAPDGSLRGDTLAGWDWVISNNSTLNIINASFGAPGQFYWFYDPIVHRLAESNILLVSSAGNNDSPEPDDDVVSAPATSIDALAVGAITYASSPSAFTAVGPTASWLAKPDVMAPGTNVITTLLGGTYGPISGTSFSSPLTVGAIATLISALDANAIPWNIGTLKASIMQTATSISAPETTVGQGIVNVSAAWELLNNVQTDSDGPMVVEITPKVGPYGVFERAISDIQYSVDFSMFASHPGDVQFSISGNLADIASVGVQDGTDYFQIMQLNINTTGTPAGIYTGVVTATVGNNTASATYTFNVQGKGRGTALFDLYHTNWDDVNQDKIGGSNTGEMIELAKDLGIWVTEKNELLTPELLAQFDILWMPDPLSLPNSGVPVNDQSLPFPLLQSEIDAIVEFVNNGGSLFVDFNGPVEFSDESTGGTNITGINSLISQFDISAQNNIQSIGVGVSRAETINSSSPVGSTTRISHVGTILDVGPTATALTYFAATDGATIAINEYGTGGRVMVTTTNFWLDNFGLAGGYGSAGGANDRIFARNTWNWLISDYGMKEISSTIDNTRIEASFEIFTNNTVGIGDPVVRVNPDGDIPSQIIIPTKIGNVYSFTYEFPGDGNYEIQAVWGDQYLSWSQVVDITPPVLSLSSTLANMTGFSGTSTLFLRFLAFDLQPLNETNFFALLDGKENAGVSVTGYLDTGITLVKVQPDVFIEDPTHWYILTFGAVDIVGNNASIDFWFYIGSEAPLLPGEEPTSSTVDPTVTTPTISTTPTSEDTGGGEDTPINSFAIFVALVGLAVTNSVIRRLMRKQNN